MMIGIIHTIAIAAQNLPPISERKYFGSWETLPLFVGISMFAFEGIALVLPLQSAMQKPGDFSKPFGVLNVGMVSYNNYGCGNRSYKMELSTIYY